MHSALSLPLSLFRRWEEFIPVYSGVGPCLGVWSPPLACMQGQVAKERFPGDLSPSVQNPSQPGRSDQQMCKPAQYARLVSSHISIPAQHRAFCQEQPSCLSLLVLMPPLFPGLACNPAPHGEIKGGPARSKSKQEHPKQEHQMLMGEERSSRSAQRGRDDELLGGASGVQGPPSCVSESCPVVCPRMAAALDF